MLKLIAHLKPEGIDGTITVMVGNPKESRGGKRIGEFVISKDAPKQLSEYSIPVTALKGIKGKQGLYFVFKSATEDKSICEFYDFQFVR